MERNMKKSWVIYITGEYSWPRDGESEGVYPNLCHQFYVTLQHISVTVNDGKWYNVGDAYLGLLWLKMVKFEGRCTL